MPGEIFRERRRLGRREHPLDLRGQIFSQLSAFREAEQFVIRHRTPDEIREPRGERDFIERLRIGTRHRNQRLRQIADENKMRRDQRGLHREFHAGLKTVALFAGRFIKFHQPVNLHRLDRSSPCAMREIRDDGARGGFGRGGIRLRSGGRNRMLREKFAQRRGHRRNQNRFAEDGRFKILDGQAAHAEIRIFVRRVGKIVDERGGKTMMPSGQVRVNLINKRLRHEQCQREDAL